MVSADEDKITNNEIRGRGMKKKRENLREIETRGHNRPPLDVVRSTSLPSSPSQCQELLVDGSEDSPQSKRYEKDELDDGQQVRAGDMEVAKQDRGCNSAKEQEKRHTPPCRPQIPDGC